MRVHALEDPSKFSTFHHTGADLAGGGAGLHRAIQLSIDRHDAAPAVASIHSVFSGWQPPQDRF